ncbi:MAG: phenylalanine--tRNA ligase subunit alpha [Candidatus Woesearchaeota archaeon]
MEIEKLSKIEIELIKELLKKERKDKYYVKEFNKDYAEVMRAFQFLSNKNLGKLSAESYKVILLTDTGLNAKKKGLPEKILFDFVKDKKEVKVSEIPMDNNEKNIAIGLLKKKGAITVEKLNNELILKYVKDCEFEEEKILKKEFPLAFEKLTDDKKRIIEDLIRRKLLRIEEKNEWYFVPEKELFEIKLEELDFIEKVDKEVIEQEQWKTKKFRKYDLTSPLPKIYGARKHFLSETIEEIKRIWIEMGFSEMEGNHIQTSFWNLDALFVPQDHPARGLQDSLFVGKDKIEKGIIYDLELMDSIKSVHENGKIANSTGWQEKWSVEVAKELMLRTHTTVLSVQTLYKLKQEKITQGKFFAIGRVYRNETIDWKHLFEFHQVEGIVVGEVNFRNLLYYLKIFYKKLGFDDVKIVPSYYPYTEPSADILVYSKEKDQWLELGGSGMFRPEVVIPLLGNNVRVLAWGMGLERIIMMKYNLKDIRDVYSSDLNLLKERTL